MFERFLSVFTPDDSTSVAVPAVATRTAWLEAAGGSSFDGGLYRVHTTESAHASDELVRAAFPEFAGRFACFGYDWLGRQLAADSVRGERHDPEIVLLEPGTGEVLEIPVPFSRFHDEELVDYSEEVLARSFFGEWLASGGEALALSECVGYQLPLFLGGQDATANLEISDLDVYWTLMGQLRVRTKGLPAGTLIRGVEIG